VHQSYPGQRASGPPGTDGAVIPPAVLSDLLDALPDAVALTDGDGVLALANRQLGEMFGYQHTELPGRLVEFLIPAGLQEAHRSHRAAYAQAPRTRPMGAGARLVGLRKDGATFPVEISLSPLPTPVGHFDLTVIRVVTEARQLADRGRAAIAAGQAHQELLDTVITSLFGAGLSLQAAMDLPHDLASQPIAAALEHLDDAIREIRDAVFTTRDQQIPVQYIPPDGAG
jgi:PAS domain S-box-containing protein